MLVPIVQQAQIVANLMCKKVLFAACSNGKGIILLGQALRREGDRNSGYTCRSLIRQQMDQIRSESVTKSMNLVHVAVVRLCDAVKVRMGRLGNIVHHRCVRQHEPRIDSTVLKRLVGGLNQKVDQRPHPGTAALIRLQSRRIQHEHTYF